ncbi:MAG: ECF transporter S component [Nitrososphaerota archaeon]|nr:ECF transporter S component [Candidatus Bathyarchaeota archaeon]MDW8048669.1 ECF transporter S component [Nitrososphaerota archaeon]
MHKKLSATIISIATISTSLVLVATVVFSISVPATQGFFNIGESMIFLTSLLFGPKVGAFAGGVGSMLADLFLGYPHYAPGTLIIKAAEGFVVGIIKKNNPKFRSIIYWKIFTLIFGLVAGGLLTLIGTMYYSGHMDISLGNTSFSLFVPQEFWIFLGTILTLSIATVGFKTEPEFGWTVFSVLCGGFVMVSGYFIYQTFFIGWLFGVQVWGLAEIPINIGQMIVGATIALPAARIIGRAFPQN